MLLGAPGSLLDLEEALDLVKVHQPNVCIMDIEMNKSEDAHIATYRLD